MSRDDVIAAIRTEMRRLQWNKADLIKASGVNRTTIADLLAGDTWPQMRTLYKVEHALGMTPGHLEALAEGTADEAPMKPPTAAQHTHQISTAHTQRVDLILAASEALTPAEQHAVVTELMRKIGKTLTEP